MGDVREHAFGLVPIKANARVYVLTCADDDDMRSWMNAIDANIPLRKERTLKLASVQDCIGILMQRGIIHDIFRCPSFLTSFLRYFLPCFLTSFLLLFLPLFLSCLTCLVAGFLAICHR